jgi:biopolymer transport protein TolR
MAMGGGPSRGGVKSDINVTPLVDVVLVLLIIFMVVTPLLQRGKDVKLPRAAKVEAERKSADPVVISVTAERRIYIEAEELGDEAFVIRMREKLAAGAGRKILLKGDTSLSFEDVRHVMALARTAGAKGISLGVEEIEK